MSDLKTQDEKVARFRQHLQNNSPELIELFDEILHCFKSNDLAIDEMFCWNRNDLSQLTVETAQKCKTQFNVIKRNKLVDHIVKFESENKKTSSAEIVVPTNLENFWYGTITENVKETETYVNQVKCDIQNVITNQEKAIADATNVFSDLTARIDRRKASVLQEIKKKTEERKLKMCEMQKKLEKHLTKSRGTKSSVELILKRDPRSDERENKIADMCEACIHQATPNVRRVPTNMSFDKLGLESIHTNVEAFGRPSCEGIETGELLRWQSKESQAPNMKPKTIESLPELKKISSSVKEQKYLHRFDVVINNDSQRFFGLKDDQKDLHDVAMYQNLYIAMQCVATNDKAGVRDMSQFENGTTIIKKLTSCERKKASGNSASYETHLDVSKWGGKYLSVRCQLQYDAPGGRYLKSFGDFAKPSVPMKIPSCNKTLKIRMNGVSKQMILSKAEIQAMTDESFKQKFCQMFGMTQLQPHEQLDIRLTGIDGFTRAWDVLELKETAETNTFEGQILQQQPHHTAGGPATNNRPPLSMAPGPVQFQPGTLSSSRIQNAPAYTFSSTERSAGNNGAPRMPAIMKTQSQGAPKIAQQNIQPNIGMMGDANLSDMLKTASMSVKPAYAMPRAMDFGEQKEFKKPVEGEAQEVNKKYPSKFRLKSTTKYNGKKTRWSPLGPESSNGTDVEAIKNAVKAKSKDLPQSGEISQMFVIDANGDKVAKLETSDDVYKYLAKPVNENPRYRVSLLLE